MNFLKKDPSICCLQETHFRSKDTDGLKVKEWKKIFHANGNQKTAGVAIHVSDKIDFHTKTVIRDKEGHYVMIKGSVQQENIKFVNIYEFNTGEPIYIKQILTDLKREILKRKQYYNSRGL